MLVKYKITKRMVYKNGRNIEVSLGMKKMLKGIVYSWYVQ